jgi:hypothetical protein
MFIIAYFFLKPNLMVWRAKSSMIDLISNLCQAKHDYLVDPNVEYLALSFWLPERTNKAEPI